MKSVVLKYSKTKIDKAGNKLKANGLSEAELRGSLEILSNWRAYHAPLLDSFARTLKKRSKALAKDSNSIVAQRLKRTSSIVLKLKSHKTMRLSAMQDIGGLRAIFTSLDEVTDLLEVYRTSKSRNELFSIDNYIDRPKRDGYRGVHLVYKVRKTPSAFIEIQIRSHLQHVWATGVEVIGTLQNSSFKTGHGDKEWLEFFALLSSIFALKEKSPVLAEHSDLDFQGLLSQTQKKIKKLQVIEQLNAYTSLYTRISKGEQKGRKGGYSLIVLDSELNTVLLERFSVDQLNEATSAYLDLEEKYYDNINKNVVLVNSGDLNKLEAGYPNYFMDTKILLRDLSLIVMGKYL